MVLEEIKSRHSVRNFSDKDVPDEILEKILEAARLAPSWVNVQPWQFIVIRNGETKQLLSKLAQWTASCCQIFCYNSLLWGFKLMGQGKL